MSHKKFKPSGKIETEFPVEIRAEIDRFLSENATYDQIRMWLNDGGFSISLSSVGRYGKKLFEAEGNRIPLFDRFPDPKKEKLYQLIEEIVELFED